MPQSVLFVCVGNICRSPMGAAILKERMSNGARVESAGIFGLSGHAASSEAVRATHERGLDLGGHRARHVRELDLDEWDLVVALTPSIADVLRSEYGVDGDRLIFLNVSDPYGSGVETFRRCLREIEDQIDRHELLGSL